MQKNKEQFSNRQLIRRLIALGVFVVFGFGVVTYNLVGLQIIRHEELLQTASEQQLRDTPIAPNRGTIYDANMKVLATSATVWNVILAPKNITETTRNMEPAAQTAYKQTIADGLSEILTDVMPEEILEKMENSESYYETISMKVDKPVADAIREFIAEEEVVGIELHQSSKRYYPYGEFASTVLGFTGSEDQGLAGLEAYYNAELSGVAGREVAAKNGWGLDMPFDFETIYEPQDGNSIVTTIDETIQHYLEKYLEFAVDEHNVDERAVGIVMNVNTGAIVAMATENDFDPNDPFTITDPTVLEEIAALPIEEQADATIAAQNEQWRNKAVSDLYEPGSVFKLVTASAALDSGLVTLDNNYNCTGSMRVDVHTMRCANTAGHGMQSFAQGLVNSCNPAFIQIGAQLGVDNFYSYAEAFGFTEPTGIDISGEAQSIFHGEDMSIVNLASSSFGQSFKITPIQMITALATIANGGNLVQPHLVSQILDSEGNIVQTIEPEVKRQVISEETAREILDIMEITVAGAPGFESPGKNAYVAGYRVGGKSGTSQKLDVDGGESVRIASFGAVAPVNDPELAVLVFLDEPNSTLSPFSYGGVLSAPIVASVLAEALPSMGIEPQYTEEEQATLEIMLQSVEGMTLIDANVSLQKKGFNSSIVGDGDTVISQFPQAGTILARGSTIVLNTEDNTLPQEVTVPDLVGRTQADALKLIEAAGLNIIQSGATGDSSVTVTEQDIAAGEMVTRGTPITVTFQDVSLID